jgi:CRP-like cAMP-binding protein
MKKLFSALQSIGNLPDAEIKRFIELARIKEIAKGSYFILEGSKTNRLGVVKKGLFQNTYLTEKGDECAFAFTAENEFIYECRAMRTFDTAQYSVQAIEDSIILEVDYKAWIEPFKDSVWWNKILLDLTTVESSEKSSREIRLMSMTGRERYAHFLENYSHIEHRIKQYMIASYLGITSVSLSRIRKEMGLID